MTQTIFALFFFVFGGFGLWGQTDYEALARAAANRGLKASQQAARNGYHKAVSMQATETDSVVTPPTVEAPATVQATPGTTVIVQAPRSRSGGGRSWSRGPAGMPVYSTKQEGAVEIAKKVSSQADLMEAGTTCVERLWPTMGDKAPKYCGDLAKKALDISKVVADQAAEATVRPPIIASRRGGWW